uniref:Uncharacterized protein n=1 Tax=Oryzias latipes TaxID=8090 RepID=A0A3P9MQE3_ORYLA
MLTALCLACMQSSGGLLICLPFSLSFFRGTDSASHGNAGEMIVSKTSPLNCCQTL